MEGVGHPYPNFPPSRGRQAPPLQRGVGGISVGSSASPSETWASGESEILCDQAEGRGHGQIFNNLGGNLDMPPPERYNTGYNVGVGGAVVKDGRLLLVRRASRRGRGNWQVPGGFIEPDETVEEAVIREVQEEAGVTAKVHGVLGLRSRYDADNGNSMYIVMLLHPGERRTPTGQPRGGPGPVFHPWTRYLPWNRCRP